MKTYSVTEAAKTLGVNRTTLQRWVRDKQVPAPKAKIVAGNIVKFWTEKEMVKLKEHKDATYWGKGIDRRTGKKAKGSNKEK